MNSFLKKLLAWAAVVCLLATPMSASAKNIVLLGDSGFEAANSYLTRDQYEGLGLHLGSAASADRNKTADPLAEFSSEYTLVETKYGWSNPQVIAVMLSSPYWDELDYGDDMTAAGSTSFSLSTGVETGESSGVNMALGMSFSASGKAEVLGNGAEGGFDLSFMMGKATEVQSSKAENKTLTFSAGAGEDHVALVVFPMVSYKYSYKASNGKTEYLYSTVQLTPVSAVTTLKNYNLVAREHNASQKAEASMLPVMDMYYMAPPYEAGDPSTGFASPEDVPTHLVFENGKLICADTNAPAENRLDGKVLVTSTSYSVAVGQADTGAEMTYEVSESEGESFTVNTTLGADVFGGFNEGFDAGVVETSFSQRLTVAGEYSTAVTQAKLNTASVSFSVGFVNLPATAQTGVTGTNVPTSDYAFKGSLMLWIPTERGDSLSIAPLILGAIVDFPDKDAMPLYLPDDVHVDGVTDTSVTLSWTNPDFDQYPFSKRRPAKYEVAVLVSGSGGNIYTVVKSVDATEQTVTLEGLKPDTAYTYALRAYDGVSRRSAYGPSVTASTVPSEAPVIVRHPTDVTVSLGESPILTVVATPAADDSTFTYQWYQLTEMRYGYAWSEIYGATQARFNAAYFEADGLVNSSNRYMLNNSIYRCVVVEKNGDGFTSAVTRAAKVKVAQRYSIRSYDDLREIALNIHNGHKEVATYQYVLENDITCPSSEAWDIPIGSASVPFSGSFDGQGHTIKGLQTKTDDGGGAFGLFAALSGATVKDLHLQDVTVEARQAHIGAVAGRATNSVIAGCSVSGSVKATAAEGGYSLGGVVGFADSHTVIERCMNHAFVTGQLDAVGGIVGTNYGQVQHCANRGDLKAYCPYFDHMPAKGYVGGVVGRNSGSVEHCYNAGEYTIDNRQISEDADICNGNKAVNSYYLNSIENAYGGRTAEQFASGRVAYELNNGSVDGDPVWYQSLDNGRTPDVYPHLTAGDDTVVYQTADGVYSNVPMIGDTRPTTGATTTSASTATVATTTKSVTTAQTPDTPKTGDSTQAFTWCLAAIVAAAVVWLSAKRSANV